VPKLLTNREMELFRCIVILARRLDDCNPEVGLGPSIETIAQREADCLSFEIDEDDMAEVCETVKGSMTR